MVRGFALYASGRSSIESKLETMRNRYLKMAASKTLVIKNPLCLARVDMLKAMFPDALFVFSLRAPWPTIQAATIKENSAYILPTQFVNNMPKDLVVRAAASWAELIDVLRRERDHDWIVVKHEELIATPLRVVADLYRRSGLRGMPDHAAHLPENRIRDYSFIKYKLMAHPYRAAIFSLITERAREFGYDPKLSALPGSGLRYAAESWLNDHWPQAKGRKHRSKQPVLKTGPALRVARFVSQ